MALPRVTVRIAIRSGTYLPLAAIITLLTMVIAVTTQAATLHVNASQTNNPAEGTSWAAAFPRVQQAIDAAAPGDSIWVASALYFESLKVTNRVALYGGFAGTENALDQRNPGAHPTVLDGGQSNRVVSFTAGADNRTRLDGFIVQNGKAPANSYVGAGIYIANASPLICNNIIRSNDAAYSSAMGYKQGGGIWVGFAPCVISNNIISYNHASSGAGIYCEAYSDCLICDNRFEGNVAEYTPPILGGSVRGGGGVCVGASKPRIINNFFLGNKATNLPSYTVGGFGGAIVVALNSEPEIVGNTMLKNRAAQGSSVADQGGGIYSESTKGIIGNNLIALGSSGVLLPYPGTSYGDRFRNNCVFSNEHNYVGADLTGTNANISADPLLAGSDDFHLPAGSPCIDAGDNSLVSPGSVDLDGQARIAGTRVDIGADEYGSALPFSPSLQRQGSSMLLTMNSEPDKRYILEASTNLITWFAVSTNLATSSCFQVQLPIDGDRVWLYRVKTAP